MSRMVRCKLYVAEIAQFAHDPEQRKIVLMAVTRGEENKEWSKYTPNGRLELSIKNPAASEFFEIGKEYFVDITEAPQPESA